MRFPNSRFLFGFCKDDAIRKSSSIGLVLAAFLIGGCTTYHPMPITSHAVDSELKPPDMDALRVLAGKIKHPILRPVKLEPKKDLSPDGAAVLAVILNPSLRSVRDQRALSNAQLLDAGLLPDPEFTYSLDVPTGGNTAGRVNAYGLGLNWEVSSIISRFAKIHKAKASKTAIDLDIAWQEWQVAQAAKSTVYHLKSLKDQVLFAEESAQCMSENLKHVQEAVVDGSVTSPDLIAARSASGMADEKLLSLKTQIDQQRLQLHRLMGLPSDSPIRLSNDIKLPSRVELPVSRALLEGLEQRRLDLLALRQGYNSQEAAVRAAVLEQFPRISIGPTISRDTDNVRTTGFGLNIALPIFNRNQGKIAKERATRQELFDEYVSRVFEARSDIERIISGIHYTNDQIAAALMTATVLGKLVINYRTALAGGRIDAPTYYTAWNDYLSSQIKVSALKGKLAQSVVALQLASGLYEIPKPGRSPETTQ